VTTTNPWSGGYQAEVTVRNNGTAASTRWTVKFAFAGSQTIVNSWNATVTQAGAQVTAANASYNGAIPAGGSTSFGFVANGANQPATGVSCSLA
jgi:cellulase/cellobiase CelA1